VTERRIKVVGHFNDESKRIHEFVGTFHGWASASNALGHYRPCAIIERDDGFVELIPVAYVQFVDRARHADRESQANPDQPAVVADAHIDSTGPQSAS